MQKLPMSRRWGDDKACFVFFLYGGLDGQYYCSSLYLEKESNVKRNFRY